MKIFIYLILFLPFSLDLKAQSATSIPPSAYDSLKSSNLKPLDKKKEGYFLKKDGKGNLLREGFLVNLNLEGKERSYYETGALLTETDYKKNKKNGWMVYYTIEGTVTSIYSLKEDKMHGPYQEFVDGKLFLEGFYLNGEKDGKQRIFRKGVISEQGNFVKGKKEGVWETYDQKGKLLLKTTWKNGVEVK
ncbi:MAG: hypothetical protein IAF38_18640 [Bacteroidia bacterium]|nr:hypothetical protein [Bacteroidia bacterium]